MTLEHVLININPKREAEYLKAFAKAKPLVLKQPGCHSCQLLTDEQADGKFLLLIEWDKQTDHTEGFRQSTDYLTWSALLHPFYDIFPELRYFTALPISRS